MNSVKKTVESTTMLELGKCVIRRKPGGEIQIWVTDIRYWFEQSKIATADLAALADLRDALTAMLADIGHPRAAVTPTPDNR